jgi:trehalose 6-phosphate phosphatase
MMAEDTPVPGELLEPLRAEPTRSAILCDIDGTLAPIVAEPDDASVPDATRTVLRALAERYALVGCLSGRRAADARRMVGVDELVYVGNHGLESLVPGANEPRLDPAVSASSERAREFVAALDQARLDGVGVRREDKGPIQSLHWRGAARGVEAELEAKAIAARAADRGLEPRWGRKVLELRPTADVDKGSAVECLIAEHGLLRALFGGDDVTDLDAFGALRRMRSAGRLEHAICLGVASDEEPPDLRERSDFVVDGTAGFLEVLRSLT